ncbi:MAG TPA: hypothetical protein VHS32_02025 [Streptosporangiaceae bacterium]|nr:hypothetical protein [Streptosporangiaceae bacterium]
MSRLTEAQVALEMLAGIAEPGADLDVDELRAAETLRAALQRMAQLEKVAELARTVTRQAHAAGDGDYHAETLLPENLLRLELAVTELDNHPDTREPTTITEL